jgi:formylmethanofuran dehydrogenase subunit E
MQRLHQTDTDTGDPPGYPSNAIFCRDHKGQPFTFEAYLEIVRAFHGHVAPGLVIGGRMVACGMDMLPPGIIFDACCETGNCLPDAVQILTPCTIGNGWLRIVPLGRFAVSLFDKHEGEGVRVAIDSRRLAAWDEIAAWFLKLKPRAEQNAERLLQQIRRAGDDLYRTARIRMQPELLVKEHLGRNRICPICQEYYPAKHGALCRGCRDESPYLEARDDPEVRRVRKTAANA